MPLIPADKRPGQGDFCEFKARLVYKLSSRKARAITQRNPVLKIPRKEGRKEGRKRDRLMMPDNQLHLVNKSCFPKPESPGLTNR